MLYRLMVGFGIGGSPGNPEKPKAWMLIRSRTAPALASIFGLRSAAATASSARARSRVATAPATVGLSRRATSITASSCADPRSRHHGPAARESLVRTATPAVESPDMA